MVTGNCSNGQFVEHEGNLSIITSSYPNDNQPFLLMYIFTNNKNCLLPLPTCPVEWVEFRLLRMGIHLGMVKIEQEEIYNDKDIKNSEAIMVGTPREEVIDRLQLALTREFERYGKVKKKDIPISDYDGRQQ